MNGDGVREDACCTQMTNEGKQSHWMIGHSSVEKPPAFSGMTSEEQSHWMTGHSSVEKPPAFAGMTSEEQSHWMTGHSSVEKPPAFAGMTSKQRRACHSDRRASLMAHGEVGGAGFWRW